MQLGWSVAFFLLLLRLSGHKTWRASGSRKTINQCIIGIPRISSSYTSPKNNQRRRAPSATLALSNIRADYLPLILIWVGRLPFLFFPVGKIEFCFNFWSGGRLRRINFRRQNFRRIYLESTLTMKSDGKSSGPVFFPVGGFCINLLSWLISPKMLSFHVELISQKKTSVRSVF